MTILTVVAESSRANYNMYLRNSNCLRIKISAFIAGMVMDFDFDYSYKYCYLVQASELCLGPIPSP
jgi:hypothetical protein